MFQLYSIQVTEILLEGDGFEKPSEACGVFGIYAPGEPLAHLTYEALQNLQHRGQQGAGISVSNGVELNIVSDLGLVKEVFNRGRNLNFGEHQVLATGHTRYGTTKAQEWMKRQALQPMWFNEEGSEDYEFSLAHNGHVEGAEKIAIEYGLPIHEIASDSEVILRMIGAKYIETGNMTVAMAEALPLFQGAYSLVISTPTELFAARDPNGFRPLHLGNWEHGGWVVASEIAALDIIGASPVREILPGEILTISGVKNTDLDSRQFATPHPSVCAFEFVYFSRPDNEINGESVTEVRKKMGELLGKRDTVNVDLVIGVPDSGLIAAKGYSRATGIPDEPGLIKNNYVDRSFIAPTQNERTQAVRNKLNVNKRLVKDRSVVVLDDSIVRGTTQKELVSMLRAAGASEVHVRVTSPPYKWPCYYGMDTGRPEELVASRMSRDQIREYIDADSLDYLTDDELQTAVGSAAGKVCTACTTGIYPVPVNLHIRSPAIKTSASSLL